MVESGRLNSREESKEFNKTLDFMSTLIQNFLQEVKGGEASMSVLKNEVEHLLKNFNDLSGNIKQNQKEIVEIQLKLQKLQDESFGNQKEIKELNSHHERKSETEITQRISLATVDTTGKWQAKVAMISGFVALLATIITTVMNHLK